MILRKAINLSEKFSWLNLLTEHSTSFNKFEIYKDEDNIDIENMMKLICKLFKDDRSSLFLGPCAIGVAWNDFADVVEEIDNFVIPVHLDPEYDNQYEVEFMKMMVESRIEFDYKGYCEILNWNLLLKLLLSIIINVNGTDSLKFYHANGNYCFYPHNSGSIGVYYQEINDNINDIIQKARKLGLRVEYLK